MKVSRFFFNVFQAVLLIHFGCFAALAEPSSLYRGALLRYNFQEPEGALQVRDRASDFDGLNRGGIRVSIDGRDRFMCFEGDGGRIVVPEIFNVTPRGAHPNTSLTVSAMVVLLGAGEDMRIVSKAEPGLFGSDDHTLMLSTFGDDKVRVRLRTTQGTKTLISSQSLLPNEWTHIAATYDGSIIRLFLNGLLDSSTAHSGEILEDNRPLTLGAQPGSLSSALNGCIDDFVIYNRVLTGDEIIELAVGAGGFYGEFCGNNAVESGEECDDGNTISGDGCSSSCQIEFCGDGVVQPDLGEQCDISALSCDPPNSEYPGLRQCGSDCQLTGVCEPSGFCGDGICNGPEDQNNCTEDCSVQMEFFSKPSGALDYMGVRVTALSSNQQVWAPGSQSQEYPGGWVTPGTYQVDLNPARIHGKFDGTLASGGTLRSGDQLWYNVISEPLVSSAFPSWSYELPENFQRSAGGNSFTVTLNAGDNLHVGYGYIAPSDAPSVLLAREGSDGIVVHCVEGQPQPRGGLFGHGHLGFDHAKWQTFRERVLEASQYFYPKTSYHFWGPADGTLPATLPSDFGNVSVSGANTDNQQTTNVGRWLLNRAMAHLKGQSVNRDELDRLFRFFFNNPQYANYFGEMSTAGSFHGHGSARYDAYESANILMALVAAVALDYDPSYEPLYRTASFLAQSPNMFQIHANSYALQNALFDGGLANHLDTSYGQWLWYNTGEHQGGYGATDARDMTARASHRAISKILMTWARELLNFPPIPHQYDFFHVPGLRFTDEDTGQSGSWYGCMTHPNGAHTGWEPFYANIENSGMQLGEFLGVDSIENSMCLRYTRRNPLFQ
ncbi:MAG: hypothetical protein KDD55_04995, partial [Bdellovibrionales bacterium]|nr:hypothetical protein [Bdellovibrionales bacterium]